MTERGVIVSVNSDDAEEATHLNQEAAKSMKYGGLSANEALKLVTLNPAIQLGIDNRVGSIEVGKDADLAILQSRSAERLRRGAEDADRRASVFRSPARNRADAPHWKRKSRICSRKKRRRARSRKEAGRGCGEKQEKKPDQKKKAHRKPRQTQSRVAAGGALMRNARTQSSILIGDGASSHWRSEEFCSAPHRRHRRSHGLKRRAKKRRQSMRSGRENVHAGWPANRKRHDRDARRKNRRGGSERRNSRGRADDRRKGLEVVSRACSIRSRRWD